jgi:hypothetical protein
VAYVAKPIGRWNAVRVKECDNLPPALTEPRLAGDISSSAWFEEHPIGAAFARNIKGLIVRTVINDHDLELVLPDILTFERLNRLPEIRCFIPRGNNDRKIWFQE